MAKTKSCCVRFNLDREEHRRAWMHLQNMDRGIMRSYSTVIIEAINQYFEHYDFKHELVTELYKIMTENEPADEKHKRPNDKSDQEIAWDFLCD